MKLLGLLLHFPPRAQLLVALGRLCFLLDPGKMLLVFLMLIIIMLMGR